MKCSRCDFETESEQGFKAHMSKSHGGFTVEDLKAQGIKPNQRDIARSLAGNESSKQVTEQAPDSEPKLGESGEPRRARKPRGPAIDPAIEAAKENIIRLRCQRIATLPYSLLAGILGEPEIKLSEEETTMLTESYVTIAKAYGWEGTSKLLLWGDVMICQTAIIMQPERKEAIFKSLGLVGQVPAETQEEGQPVE